MIAPRHAIAATLSVLSLAGCSADTIVPDTTPPPAGHARPAPRPPQGSPTQAIVAPAKTWLDAPQTQGDWSYRSSASQTSSQFRAPGGSVLFAMTCNAGSRAITLTRPGAADRSGMMRILSSDESAVIEGRADADGVTATVPANRRILAAMAFSRGRFAVETAGMPTLYLPAWAEVVRVVEDCN